MSRVFVTCIPMYLSSKLVSRIPRERERVGERVKERERRREREGETFKERQRRRDRERRDRERQGETEQTTVLAVNAWLMVAGQAQGTGSNRGCGQG